MSGTGQKNTAAPTRLTPIAIDQPIGQGADSTLIFPSQYFAQSYTRLLAYLGQPGPSSGGGSGGGSNMTITEQLSALTTLITENIGALSAGIVGLTGRVAALEAALANIQAFPRSPSEQTARTDSLIARVEALEQAVASAKTIVTWGM